MMCRVLEVSSSGYYAWRKRRDTPPAGGTPRAKRAAIADLVIDIFNEHNGFAGARTIYRQLQAQNVATTLYAVRKIMADNTLHTKYRRAFKRTTIQDPQASARADLLRRRFYPAMPTTYLCGDITYLRTAQGWMYLAVVIDLSTRMVVGWQIADRMSAQLVVDALTMAHAAGFVAGNAVFHSDRGSQYTSKQFAQTAKKLDVRLSTGAVGVCWDNAVAESMFSTLKLHLLYEKKQFASKFDARYEVGHWIEAYYNRRRIHSTTGLIPAEAMSQFKTRCADTHRGSLTPTTKHNGFTRPQDLTQPTPFTYMGVSAIVGGDQGSWYREYASLVSVFRVPGTARGGSQKSSTATKYSLSATR